MLLPSSDCFVEWCLLLSSIQHRKYRVQQGLTGNMQCQEEISGSEGDLFSTFLTLLSIVCRASKSGSIDHYLTTDAHSYQSVYPAPHCRPSCIGQCLDEHAQLLSMSCYCPVPRRHEGILALSKSRPPLTTMYLWLSLSHLISAHSSLPYRGFSRHCRKMGSSTKKWTYAVSAGSFHSRRCQQSPTPSWPAPRLWSQDQLASDQRASHTQQKAAPACKAW